jgi:hypothetical protein
MKWLTREKRNPFIAVVAITALALALIWLGLIRAQKDSLSQIASSRKSAGVKLSNIEKMIKNADAIANELADETYTLSRAEDDMASGDLYSWTYSTIRLFKQKYKVEIPDIGHPSVGDVDIIASFPYKQLRFSIDGVAYYHDLGKFIADFENAFPHARVVNLTLEPSGIDSEKLSFRMDIVVLIKPNAS